MSLHKAVFQKWLDTKTSFKLEEAESWVDRPPKSESAEDLLAWATEHPFLKVTCSAVPDGIFPQGTSVNLHDIVVKTPKRKRGPRIIDDDLYDAFPHLRTYVPRGVCILELLENKIRTLKIVIFSLSKFTGGPGDDDDQAGVLEEEAEHKNESVEKDTEEARSRWEHYFIQPVKTATKIITTSKENGESAHVGQFRHQGQIYLLFGSKNVHLLVKTPQDIELYTDTRFNTAKSIATSMVKQFTEDSRVQRFLDFMEENEYSSTFEFLNIEYQHVEFFDFEQNKYRFITFSSCKNLTQICAHDFDRSIQVAKDSGFETITVEHYDYSQQDEAFSKIRNAYGKEGSVLYYYSGEKCIGMMKKKSAWYVCLRAIREKIKGFSVRIHKEDQQTEEKMERFKTKVKETIKQKQEWIGFDDESREAWIALAIPFIDWIKEGCLNGTISQDDIHKRFPVVWNKFLKQFGLNDNIQVKDSKC